MPRALLIDDEELWRELLREGFEGIGYEVLDAPDGEAGVKLLDKTAVDLVVTDIVMPEQDGLGAIRAIKKEHPEIRIIAYSGGGRVAPDSYLVLAQKFGADRTFTKPLDLSELLATARDLIGEV